MPLSLLRFVATVLLAALAFPAAGQEPPPVQKYRLKESLPVKGDAYTQDGAFEMTMDIMAKVVGTDQQFGPLPMTFRQREKYSENVLEADKKGASHVRRTYSVSRSVNTPQPGQPPKTKTNVRQGKTVVMKRFAGKAVITATPGKLPADEIAELKKEFLKESHPEFFPEHEVAPGDEWTIEGEQAARIFGGAGFDKATMKARFEEIVPFQGRQCARVHVMLEIEGKADAMPMTMSVEGKIHHALDIQRTLSADLQGTVSMTSQLDQGGSKLDLEGTGPAKFTWTVSWLKSAGRPVPPPK